MIYGCFAIRVNAHRGKKIAVHIDQRRFVFTKSRELFALGIQAFLDVAANPIILFVNHEDNKFEVLLRGGSRPTNTVEIAAPV